MGRKGPGGRKGPAGRKGRKDRGSKKDKDIDKYLSGIHQKDKRVKKELDRRMNPLKGQLKLLLLGAGESGKTTVQKQIQIIHGGGFDEVERKRYRQAIWMNIIEGLDAIIKASATVNIPIEGDEDAIQIIQDEFARVTDFKRGNSRPRKCCLFDSMYILDSLDKACSRRDG